MIPEKYKGFKEFEQLYSNKLDDTEQKGKFLKV